MYLAVVGVSHKTAPLEIRERLSVEKPRLGQALAKLKSHAHSAEFCIVSTCNRTELYTVTHARVEDDMLVSFLAAHSGVTREELVPCVYHRSGRNAIRHLFEVACGLDSMALGETQILGQIKDAYCAAEGCECTGSVLNSLFRRAIEVGKRARTETEISRGVFSLGAAAAQLARAVFGELVGRKALLIGAGEMGKLAATHLQANGIGKLHIVSRTVGRVEHMARELGAEPADMKQLDRILREVDFVISSTAAPRPLITARRMLPVMHDRDHAPLLMIDIAVPRDIAPQVGDIAGVYLYNIDDLQFFLDRCRLERESEVDRVHAIIDAETTEFMTHLRSLEALPLIKQLREKFDSVYAAEWEKYSPKLAHLSQHDRDYIRKLLRSTVKKLAHDPILRMKRYASDGAKRHKLEVVREIFDLPPAPPRHPGDSRPPDQG